MPRSAASASSRNEPAPPRRLSFLFFRPAAPDNLLRFVALAIPIFLLIVSWHAAPRLSELELSQRDLPILPGTPTFLYRNKSTNFFYTSGDLLTVKTANNQTIFPKAIIVPILPVANPSTRNPNTNLDWLNQIEARLTNGPPTRSQFRATVDGLRIERGRAAIVPLTQTNSVSGIQAIVLTAVFDPGRDYISDDQRGSPQRFDEGLRAALTDLSKAGVDHVGIPYIAAHDRLGDNDSRSASWLTMLKLVDIIAFDTQPEQIIFGGYGTSEDGRRDTDAGFREAWSSYRAELSRRVSTMTQEPIRLGALVLLSAVLTDTTRRRTRMTAARLFALIVGAITVSGAVAGWYEWLQPLLGRTLDGLSIVAAKVFVALLCGAALENIVRFDPKASL